MREILFRGKRVDNGEWAEGQYYKRTHYYGDYSVKRYIIASTEDLDYDQVLEYYEVIPETLGQFTGLLDKNGKKIFEGDIVKLDNSLDTKQKNFEVKFTYGQFYIGINKPVAYVRDSCEVIGNIHDNPELLER